MKMNFEQDEKQIIDHRDLVVASHFPYTVSPKKETAGEENDWVETKLGLRAQWYSAREECDQIKIYFLRPCALWERWLDNKADWCYSFKEARDAVEFKLRFR